MATLRCRAGLLIGLGSWLVVAPTGCSKPVGLAAPVTPLANVHVQVTGDFTSVVRPDVAADAPHLHVALMWGMQWLPEPFCLLPPASSDVATVLAAGCRDSFGFVPARVGADIEITPGIPATIQLVSLPAADVMVGDLSARVAYASLIVYDDRNGNRTLDVLTPPRPHRRNQQPPPVPVEDGGPPETRDIVYGASFISMTLPDRRVAFREGGFNPNVAFYPRAGCEGPPAGFSILSAGGFSPTDAIVNALQGQLPAEDPSTCAIASLDDTVVIPLQAPSTGLAELACTANDSGGTTFYIEAPAATPGLAGRAWACAAFPHLPGDDAGVATGQQLVLASAPSEACQYVNHYTLRGCNNDPTCSPPGWDSTAAPPSWWPCPTSP